MILSLHSIPCHPHNFDRDGDEQGWEDSAFFELRCMRDMPSVASIHPLTDLPDLEIHADPGSLLPLSARQLERDGNAE